MSPLDLYLTSRWVADQSLMQLRRRTNPVEAIYGALPALLLFNPSLVRDLLQPLLEFQSSSRYPNNYAAPDIGGTFFLPGCSVLILG